MKPVWAFDLDGCLVGAVLATNLRPQARELLERLRDRGVAVVIWSAGGGDYARTIAETVGIADLVGGYYAKVRGPDGKWIVTNFPPHHRPSVFVDDEPASIPEEMRSIGVAPYLGANRHDRGLECCFDELGGN